LRAVQVRLVFIGCGLEEHLPAPRHDDAKSRPL
jgi:hypothetical protein